MSKVLSLQILFASAAIMLCIAYYIAFYHQKHGGYTEDNTPFTTITFVPVIASSLCFLFYALTRSETYKKFGIACVLIYLIPEISLLIVVFSSLANNEDFKLDTSLNGFAEAAPLLYFIALLLGKLLFKKTD